MQLLGLTWVEQGCYNITGNFLANGLIPESGVQSRGPEGGVDVSMFLNGLF